MEIREGAIEMLVEIYKDNFGKTGGNITKMEKFIWIEFKY